MKGLILLICYLKVISAVIYELSDEEYDLMPPIFKLDSFDSCLKEPHGVYCSTYLTFVSDEDSDLLRMMQEFSDHIPTHYNHTRALYGTCITKTCMHLYKGKAKKDLTTVLEACLNETLWKEYKLKTVTEDMSCTFEDDNKMEIHWSYIVIAVVCMCIVMLNIIGSLYDNWIIKKEPGISIPVLKSTILQSNILISVSTLLLCFSIPRNWKVLTSPVTISDKKFEILKSINGYRAISMMCVVTGHALLPPSVMTESPKFFESTYKSDALYIFKNGSLIMQTFFVMSSFLLAYNHLLLSEKYQITWSLLPTAVLKRWLRLTPSYALVLAVTATWFRYFGSGPLWDKIVVTEARACESDWWYFILFFNNYVDGSLCGIQYWYLAADTQLYIVGVTVFIICTTVSPKKVLSILLVIGLIIPALHTYFQDLDGILIVSPNAATSFFTEDATFNHVYKRGHTNLAGSVVGLAAGYLVYHLQRTNFDLSQYKLCRPLYWLIFPVCLVILVSCKVYYGDYPRFGILHRVLVSAVLRPVFAIFVATILIGMIFKYETVYRGILEWNGWTTLSRISYSVYLVHMLVIKVLVGQMMVPLPAYVYAMVQFQVCALTLTYFTGYIFYLTVESPLSNLISIIVETLPKSKRKKISPQNETKEESVKEKHADK